MPEKLFVSLLYSKDFSTKPETSRNPTMVEKFFNSNGNLAKKEKLTEFAN